jgi:hypothetical protein
VPSWHTGGDLSLALSFSVWDAHSLHGSSGCLRALL